MLNEDLGFSGDMNQLKASAEAGDAEAQFNLGVLYEKGIGVPQDWEEAAEWYRKAAEQDHADAQNKLSECYYNGTGVPQDEKQAIYWYHRAAKLGDAEEKLRECRGESTPKRKNRKREDEPIGPVTLILGIVMFAFGAVAPFVMPGAADLTPVFQFIIAYLYSLILLIETIFDRISMRSQSVILLLYFLSWAASIVFGILFVNGTTGIWMIFFPIMFWGLILVIKYFKNNWQADKP